MTSLRDRIGRKAQAALLQRKIDAKRAEGAAQARQRQKQLLEHYPNALRPAEEIARIRQYAGDVWRHPDHAEWLIAYAMLRGEFIEGCLPQSYFFAELQARWPVFGRLRARNMQRRLLMTDRFPDIAMRFNGHWFDRNDTPLELREVRNVVFADAEDVVVKVDRSKAGDGVSVVTRDDFDPAALPAGDLVIQTRVKPHPVLHALMPDNAVTIRVVTAKSATGQAEVRIAVIRVGNVDGMVRMGSTVKSRVIDDEGTLCAAGHDGQWRLVDRVVPEAEPFGGVKIPKYREIVELVTTLHNRCPLTNMIGWDLTVDAEGDIQIFEWNLGNVAISYSEAIMGPCFAGLGWEPR